MPNQPRFDQLQPVPRGGNPLEPSHLVYSRRWLVAGGMILGAGIGALGASPSSLRRRVVRTILAGLAGMGIPMLIAGLAGIWRLRVERHTLKLRRWPVALDGLRVAHLSDLHLGPPYSRSVLRRALAAVRVFQPDIVLLSGDFVHTTAHLPMLREMLHGVAAPLGVFACLGNHDYWDDPAAVARMLTECGVDVLINEHRVVCWRGESLVVAGVADPWQADADLPRALAGAPADLPVLLLAHGPDFISTAARHKVALQLSGHAHAGHINLPLLGALVLPRWGVNYPHGSFTVEESGLYVSRGLGGLPFRLGATPEVALLTLEASDQ